MQQKTTKKGLLRRTTPTTKKGPEKPQNLRRSATEAQLGLEFEHELEFVLESELGFAFEFEFEFEFDFAL